MTIYIAASPIGNFRDASIRLVEMLQNVDIIAAEDTRKTIDLLRRLDIKTTAQLISLHIHSI